MKRFEKSWSGQRLGKKRLCIFIKKRPQVDPDKDLKRISSIINEHQFLLANNIVEIAFLFLGCYLHENLTWNLTFSIAFLQGLNV